MLQDSKTKIEVIRMQILQAVQTNELAFDNGKVLWIRTFLKTFSKIVFFFKFSH